MLTLDHTLRPVPRLARLEANTVESGCSGVAGAFRYEVAMAIGGPSLLRAVDRNAFIAASRLRYRRRIADGPGRRARHTADMLEQAPP